MTKRLSLLLFLSILETILMPGFLAAGDNLRVKSPEFHAVETVEIENAAKTQIEQPSTNNGGGATATLAKTTSSVTTALKNSINIAGRTLGVVDVANTTVDAGGHVNRYGGKFYYGHNSGAVFGGLTTLGVGSTFSIVDGGGSTTNYRVEKVVIFEKNNGQLQINGTGNYMNAVAGAIHLGTHYSVSIMTCYGTSYGNGDASHRLVLFANAI